MLCKAQSVTGANLVLRNATVADAEFIFSLRIDPIKRRYLASSPPELAEQVAWLRRYEAAGDEAYFVVSDRAGASIGCLRLHDALGASYNGGSWLMVSGQSPRVLIEARSFPLGAAA